MGATGPHFSEAELRCRGKNCSVDGTHGCGINGCKPSLIDALEAFREKIGKPVLVNDAYRCPKHNGQVGGAGKSEHMLGLGADVTVRGMTAGQLEAVARTIPAIRGIGRDDQKQYIHVDVRPTLTLAHWCYQTGSNGITKVVPWHASPEAVINA